MYIVRQIGDNLRLPVDVTAMTFHSKRRRLMTLMTLKLLSNTLSASKGGVLSMSKIIK